LIIDPALNSREKARIAVLSRGWPNDIPVIRTTGSKPIGAQKLSPPFVVLNIK
jgi:hypothetical protein